MKRPFMVQNITQNVFILSIFRAFRLDDMARLRYTYPTYIRE